ncbi:MAG: GNAT family N-acetyltransferase [Bacteroidales bacterium]|nr:GNAT family N-acetyltransferase [Bacteroidales bacterium]OJX91739.1 MAG: hypothetical protein BGP01_02640 [Paludibacter sp. 47-17]
MVIKTYTRKELSAFIESDFYAILSKVPISPHRAVSQVHNPALTDDDVLLWVAYENAATIGYIGVLPDRWNTPQLDAGICWLSCFWVDEKHRKGNVASTLMMAVLREHRHHLMISNFLFSLEESYFNMGIFHPVVYKNGYDYYIRARFTKLIVSKYPQLVKMEPVIAGAERLVNQVFSIWQWLHPRLKVSPDISADLRFDEELDEFLTTYTTQHDLNKRGASYFKWIYDYRWVKEGKKDKNSERYFFSSVSDRFNYVPVRIYDQQQLSGFAFLKLRDNVLTVSYLYADDRYLADLASYIFNLVKTEQIDVITCYDARLCRFFMKLNSRYILKRKRRQPYLFPLGLSCSAEALQEGEGDSVFT